MMENGKALKVTAEFLAAGQGSVRVCPRAELGTEWSDIRDAVRTGRAGTLLPVGTEVRFKLKNGEEAETVVVSLDHYGENDAVFWFRKIVGCWPMNHEPTNKGGFAASALKEWLEAEFFELLPDGLKEVAAVHKTVQVLGREEISESEGYIFLPSEYEIAGRCWCARYNGLDKQFEFTKPVRNRIAYDWDGDPMWYWTADPSSAYATYFCAFLSDGVSLSYGAHTEGGVAPLFVIN